MERKNNLTTDLGNIMLGRQSLPTDVDDKPSLETQLSNESPQLPSLPPPPLSPTAQSTKPVIATDEYVKKNHRCCETSTIGRTIKCSEI